MHEFHIRILLGHPQGGIQVAEAGGDDELGPLFDHAFHNPFRIRGLGNIFDLDYFHLGKVLLHDRDSLGVGLVVAAVGHGTDVDDSHLQFRLSQRRFWETEPQDQG